MALPTAARGSLLNAAELREMQANGMEIGSHTVNHVRLTEVDDMRLMQELTESKAALEDLLGSPVGSFAYPYGAWDARCAMAVKQAGYIGSLHHPNRLGVARWNPTNCGG